MTGISYSSAYALLRSEEGDSTSDYQNSLIRKRGFPSQGAYRKEVARRHGFESPREYSDYLVRQKGFESDYAYRNEVAHQKGFESDYAYRDDWARRQGYVSISDYRAATAQQRSHRPRYRAFSQAVRDMLAEIGRSQAWLAKQLKVSRQAVSAYARGYSIPNGKRLTILIEVAAAADSKARKSLEEIASVPHA